MNNRKIFARLLFDAVLLIAALSCPWWLFCILAFFGIIYWENFYEALVAAILFDALFGLPVALGENLSFQYFFFAAFLVAYIIVAYLKTKIR